MNRRAFLLACVAAVAFGLLGAGDGPLGVIRLSLCGAALAAIAAIDVAEHRVPNRVVLPAAAVCAALSVIDGMGLPALLIALAIVGTLLLVALVWPAALGMGDVKLALLMVVGLDGDASRALAAGLVLAALAGVLVIVRSGPAARRRALPLAPFLAAGSLLVLLS
ncbi:MAG TPA: prepilin peptidase [Solirubrobacteraceae bacterium]